MNWFISQLWKLFQCCINLSLLFCVWFIYCMTLDKLFVLRIFRVPVCVVEGELFIIRDLDVIQRDCKCFNAVIYCFWFMKQYRIFWFQLIVYVLFVFYCMDSIDSFNLGINYNIQKFEYIINCFTFKNFLV